MLSRFLQQTPFLYILARAIYYRRKISRRVRLLCYAKGQSIFESHFDLGPGFGEVEIETLRTTMNTGTERALFYALENSKVEFPYEPSASGVGKIVRVGKGVQNFKINEIVAGPLTHSSGRILRADQLVKVKMGISLDEAAHLHLAIIAIQGIRMGRISEGDKIICLGQGVIGRLATLIARSIGAHVICVAQSKAKLQLFEETEGVALQEPGSEEKLAHTQASVVIDATGNPSAISLAARLVQKRGRIVLLGSNRGKTKDLQLSDFTEKQISIAGAHIRNIQAMPTVLGHNYQEEGSWIQDQILRGMLSLKSASNLQVKCADFAELYQNRLFENADITGVTIDWSQSAELKRKVAAAKFTVKTPVNVSALRPLKMALIGCGDIASVNAEAIRSGNAFEIAAVMDSDLVRAKRLGAQLNVPFTTQYDEILSDPKIDVVFIATPHSLHESLALKAAQAKKHILVEKPLAIHYSEGVSMIQAARENGVVLRTFFPFAYEYQKTFAKNLIDEGALGPLRGFSMEYHRDRSRAYWFQNGQLSWRGRKDIAGGGFLLMYLVHALDSLRHISGIQISEVHSIYDTLSHPIEVEDTIAMIFKGTKGEIGSLSGGSAVRGQGGSHLRIWGEAGQILMNDQHLRFYSNRPVGQFHAQHWHEIKTARKEPRSGARKLFLDDFRNRIEKLDFASLDESGMVSLGLVEAAYNSQKQGTREKVQRMVALAESEKAHA